MECLSVGSESVLEKQVLQSRYAWKNVEAYHCQVREKPALHDDVEELNMWFEECYFCKIFAIFKEWSSLLRENMLLKHC